MSSSPIVVRVTVAPADALAAGHTLHGGRHVELPADFVRALSNDEREVLGAYLLSSPTHHDPLPTRDITPDAVRAALAPRLPVARALRLAREAEEAERLVQEALTLERRAAERLADVERARAARAKKKADAEASLEHDKALKAKRARELDALLALPDDAWIRPRGAKAEPYVESGSLYDSGPFAGFENEPRFIARRSAVGNGETFKAAHAAFEAREKAESDALTARRKAEADDVAAVKTALRAFAHRVDVPALDRAEREGYRVELAVVNALAQTLADRVPAAFVDLDDCAWKTIEERAFPSAEAFALFDRATEAVQTENARLGAPLGRWTLSRISRIKVSGEYITGVVATLDLPGVDTHYVTWSHETVSPVVDAAEE